MESLAAVAAVLVFAWWCGRLVRGIGQPPVVGELAAGILLGPSVFGALAPAWAARVFTPDSRSVIGELAQAAVLVFMFLVGLELDTAILRRHAAGVVRIAVVNLALPFAIGVALAIALYPSMHGDVANRSAFILFVGTALAITALPAWTMLGLVAGLVRGHANIGWVIGMSAGYVATMFGVVRPMLARLADARDLAPRYALSSVLWILTLVAMVAVSAMAAEAIGIHAVFGAFVAGTCVPRRAGVLEGLEKPLHQVSVALLPAFFVLVGLRTQIGLLGAGASWMTIGVIIACASAGKMGGGAVAARTLGFSWRDSFAIGALLNTRGLVALVALDIGRTLGILSSELFTICVVMTFVTTFATVPILRALGLRPLTPG
jgi:Kef-type K+ transport system membrane component KefB